MTAPYNIDGKVETSKLEFLFLAKYFFLIHTFFVMNKYYF